AAIIAWPIGDCCAENRKILVGSCRIRNLTEALHRLQIPSNRITGAGKAPRGRLQSEGTSICESFGRYKDQGWKESKPRRGHLLPLSIEVEVGRARIMPIKAVRIIGAPTLLPSPLLLLIAAASAKPAREA